MSYNTGTPPTISNGSVFGSSAPADADADGTAERMMDMDDRRERLDQIELRADHAHVFLQGAQDRRRVLQNVDALRGGDCKDCGGENEGCAVDALVIHDDTRSWAEPA